MKVFISWSGSSSQAVAEALRDWLPSVLQFVKPWVSSRDIPKGARWRTDLSKELEDTQFGIICLTPDNLKEPWIHFEAGALSKAVDESYVVPYLFRLKPSAVEGPLSEFQYALADRADTLKLVQAINKAKTDNNSEDALDPSRAEIFFNKWWSELETKLQNVTPGEAPIPPKRPPEEMLEEILESVRGLGREVPSSLRKLEHGLRSISHANFIREWVTKPVSVSLRERMTGAPPPPATESLATSGDIRERLRRVEDAVAANKTDESEADEMQENPRREK